MNNIVNDLKDRLEKLRVEWKERPDMRHLTEKRAKILKALLEKHDRNKTGASTS